MINALLYAQEAAETALTVDIQLLNFVAGFVVPLLVGLLTKLHAPSGLKAVLNLGLSAIAGALTTAIAASGNILLEEWVTGIAMTWLISVVSYYGLWKPSGAAPAIAENTRSFGIGQPPFSSDT